MGLSAYQTHAINLGLSLFPFSTLPTLDNSNQPATMLDASQQVSVWAYSIHSRTSNLGVIIAIAGCVAVILRTVVCLLSKSENLGLTELLVVTAKQPTAERLYDERTEEEYAQQRVLLNKDERVSWPVFDFV
ncbi:hypothetical protein BJX63DRAFT_310025 [Aspergillus granulosus]|uniref:Uncharacterized protein n=1 Tax=Aspergillus granulosus TaxID=176169 RepID=A0ABR4H588_9EURO